MTVESNSAWHDILTGQSEIPSATQGATRGATRRQFLSASAAAIAASSMGARTMHALTVAIPRTTQARRSRPEHWLPDQPQAEQLRSLALIAMDAARSAGADAADIRMGVQRFVDVGGYESFATVGLSVGYGIRAWYGGTWSFQHGNVLTSDAVTATARSAVAGARRYAEVNTRLATHRRGAAAGRNSVAAGAWADAPVVTGEWQTPVAIDPFTVPIDDYQRFVDTLRDVTPPPFVPRSAHVQGHILHWRGETRVFASMAGSLVTQDFLRGGMDIQVVAHLPPDMSPSVFLHVPGFDDICAGFETVFRPEIRVEMARVYEEAVRWCEIPYRSFDDVGRFPVVLDGRTMAGVMGSTISNALDGDRVSRLEADASGGSFLMPLEDILNASKPQFSPLLTARVDRALPSPMAAQWDDDGVVPEPYTVLEQGRVVDFHTTRETAPMLLEWNQQHGRPVRSHGSSVAPTPSSVPRGTGGHLRVAPSASATTIEDLTKDISHGFLIINGGAGPTPGLTGGIIGPRQDGLAIEIRRGVPIARTNVKLQFMTQVALGKNLRALGDATTNGSERSGSTKGIPWQQIEQMATAPAAYCLEMDVIR